MKNSPSRILKFRGILTKEDFIELNQKFEELEKTSGAIICDIDTEGGDFEGGIRFYYTLRNAKNPIFGIVTGTAYSAGFMILEGCSIRYAHPSSTFMAHAPLGETPGILIEADQTEEKYLELHRRAFRYYQPKLIRGKIGTLKVLRERSNILSENQIEDLMRSEMIFDAFTALRYGFIDEVL